MVSKNKMFLVTRESNEMCTRQALLNVYLSPESIKACKVQFDCTNFKEDAFKNKSLSDDNVCQISKTVVSGYGIQLPVFSSKSQSGIY